MPCLDILNTSFGQGEALRFMSGPGGLPQAVLRMAGSEARVLLQGAQVIHYQPAGHTPVLWVSQAAAFDSGKSVRGGIPICWPWFGVADDDRPAHGFARNLNWQVAAAGKAADIVWLTLKLHPTADTYRLWPHAFCLSLTIELGAQLRLSLTTEHRGDTPCEITQGLHTYLAVGDIQQIAILGLGSTPYLDKTEGMRRKLQHEEVLHLNGETDRIYLDTLAEVIVEDPLLHRRVHVRKEGSRSTVIWNPWESKAKRLPDMHPEEYRQMLCVETTNAGEDRILLTPGGVHTLVSEILAFHLA